MYTPTQFLQLLHATQIDLPERPELSVDDVGYFETARRTENGKWLVRVVIGDGAIMLYGFNGHEMIYQVEMAYGTPEFVIAATVKAAVED